jgi:hypothetical protein
VADATDGAEAVVVSVEPALPLLTGTASSFVSAPFAELVIAV